ncbi:MAG: Spy/CpxP family protein refolding chaperone [Deltaproteobacteria bacterium]|jgi:Spy/CpxP family protein refolding chaperone|nr:Spy/CpxP family protein refolding chaperone [Deltaproteobacteria bacterium]
MVGRLFLNLFLLIIFSTSAFGQGAWEGKGPGGPWRKGQEFRERRGMRGPMHGSMMGDWAQRLNLTEEQKTSLQKLRESYLKDTLILRNKLVIQRFDLKALLANPQADPDQVLAKQREISGLESKLQERTVIYRLETRQVLTPEQIELLPPGLFIRGFHGHWMMPGQGRGMGRE